MKIWQLSLWAMGFSVTPCRRTECSPAPTQSRGRQPTVARADDPGGRRALAECRPARRLECESGGRGFITGNQNFPNFIGYVSNPLFAIDPRAVSIWYPIFGSNWIETNPRLPNGNFQLYGAGLNLALTERLAVGLNQGGYAHADFERKPLSASAAATAKAGSTSAASCSTPCSRTCPVSASSPWACAGRRQRLVRHLPGHRAGTAGPLRHPGQGVRRVPRPHHGGLRFPRRLQRCRHQFLLRHRPRRSPLLRLALPTRRVQLGRPRPRPWMSMRFAKAGSSTSATSPPAATPSSWRWASMPCSSPTGWRSAPSTRRQSPPSVTSTSTVCL